LLESYVRDSEIHRVDLSAKLCQACAQLPSVLICSSEVSDEWVTEVALATAIIGALPNNLVPSTENSDVQHEARFDSALLLLQSCPHQDMLAAAAIAPLLRRGNQASLERTETTVLQVSCILNQTAQVDSAICSFVPYVGAAHAEACARAAAASERSRAAHAATLRARASQSRRSSRQIANHRSSLRHLSR
jgi:hypothetical protein